AATRKKSSAGTQTPSHAPARQSRNPNLQIPPLASHRHNPGSAPKSPVDRAPKRESRSNTANDLCQTPPLATGNPAFQNIARRHTPPQLADSLPEFLSLHRSIPAANDRPHPKEK